MFHPRYSRRQVIAGGATAVAPHPSACRATLAPFKRVRRLEFAELPKTISGKIRRVELRRAEAANQQSGKRASLEFWEDDFSEAEIK